MGTKLRLEDESVWTALEAMRQAKPLGLAHPLTGFMTLRPLPGARHTVAIEGGAAQDALIFSRLSNFIAHRLQHHRAVSGLAAEITISNGASIKADFSIQNDELEAWSVIYHRYVRVDLGLSLEQLAAFTPQDKRTLTRRQRRGIARLTQELVQREFRLRNRYRSAALKAELPGYAPKLFGREALIKVALEQLERPEVPRHILLYGLPGIGKTALALWLAHWLVDGTTIDSVAWLEQPDNDAQRLLDELQVALRLPASEEATFLASYLYRSDALIVLNHAQALVDNGAAFDSVVQALGMARLIVCVERPPAAPLYMPSLSVPELNHEFALKLLEYISKERSRLSKPLEHLNRLYNELGGNPAALIRAVQFGPRYRSEEMLSSVYRAAWDNAPELSRLVWLVMALCPMWPQDKQELADTLSKTDNDRFDAALAYLCDAAVLQWQGNGPSALGIPNSARSFVDTILPDSTYQPLVWTAMQRRADRLVEQPDSVGCVLLLKAAQKANLSVEVQVDLAYTFAAMVARAGAWSAWARFLDPLVVQVQAKDRLWLGVQLGIARRWLAQWKSAAYGLASVIEEAGASGDFHVQAEALVELATIYRHQRQLGAAAELLQRAEEYYRRHSVEADSVRVAAERVQLALDSGKVDSAWTTLEKMVERRGFNSPRLLSLAALVALRADRPHEALRYAQDAQQEYQGDLPHFARASALLGEIHFKIGNFGAAVDAFTAALDLMEQTHDLLGHARTCVNLSAVYLGQGNLRKALELLRPLPAELERLGDTETLVVALKNLALLNKATRHWKARSA